MTAQPALFGKDRLAHLLHVPPMFIDRLIDHGLLPDPTGPDQTWPEPKVRALLASRPWLRILTVPLSRVELHRLNPSLRMPSDAVVVSGRPYAPLWHAMDDAWGRDASRMV